MAFETREGEGSLFSNHKTTEQQPDFTGRCRLGGVLYRLAGWNREAQSGRHWMALKIQPDQTTTASADSEPVKATQAPAPDKDFDDDIPF
jgi:hypothetical protein